MNNDIGYLGDDAWQNFANLFREEWDKFDRKEEVLKLVNNDEMIAMVVSQVSSQPEKWLVKKIPALQGKTPLWCLKNGKIKQLKSILMSIPTW